MSPFALLDPVVSVLHRVLLLLAAHLPGPAGLQAVLALAVLTLLLRAAMLPLALRAYRGQVARTALGPQLEEIRRRHADDPKLLLERLRQAHRDAGLSPFAGVGSAVLQLPVFTGLYRLVRAGTVSGMPNILTTASLFGTPLSSHWLPVLGALGPLSPLGVLFVATVAVLLGLGYLSSRQQPEAPAALRLLAYASTAVAVVMPIAFSAYLLSTTAWTVGERAAFSRLS